MAHERASRHGPPTPPILVVVLLALAPLIAWSGCSAERRFEVMSFFFDGVPDPSAPQFVAGASPRSSPTFTIHQPYAEARCRDCHSGGRFSLESQDSSICAKCHENVPTAQPRMHGPVAAEACLWCHAPHQSAFAHLLKGPPRQVCSSCHEPAMLDAQRVPEHADEAVSCLDCHYGHGGVSRHFLRAGADAREFESTAAQTREPPP